MFRKQFETKMEKTVQSENYSGDQQKNRNSSTEAQSKKSLQFNHGPMYSSYSPVSTLQSIRMTPKAF